MNDDISCQQPSIGELWLCRTRRMLIGPHGQVELDVTPYALAERLMQQPGEMVETKVLMTDLPRGVARTPGEAVLALHKQVQALRGHHPGADPQCGQGANGA